MEPPSKRKVELETLSDEELIQLERDLLKGYNGFDEKMAAAAEEQKQLDARLEEVQSTYNQITAELESKGYRIVNGEVIDLIDMEPLRKWAAAANAAAAKGWAEISEKPGQDAGYAELLKKYLTGGSEEDVCDPANVEDEKASEDEDEKEIKQEQ
ncbi:hypothetical protein KCU77_g17242, partial [Aureobasidium melanogenum]